MHEVNRLTDLTHEVHTLALCQDVVAVDDSLKQLSTGNAAADDERFRLCNTDREKLLTETCEITRS